MCGISVGFGSSRNSQGGSGCLDTTTVGEGQWVVNSDIYSVGVEAKGEDNIGS